MIDIYFLARRLSVLLVGYCVIGLTACAELPQIEMNLPEGFVAEQIYEVPNDSQGSWISMAVDDRGRLITSDQNGGLYRLTIPPDDASAVVEEIDLPIGMAMGLLHTHDTLYVMVNGESAEGPGLYAVKDTDGDDRYDSVRLLRGIDPPGRPGAGHGNHAIVLGPTVIPCI